jgi:hypothetical protein
LSPQNVNCAYCGNPRPNVIRETQDGTQTGFSLRGLFSRNRQRFQIIDPTPLVDCALCGRRYYLFATPNDQTFIDEFLQSHVMLADNVISSMVVFGVMPEDLASHIIGITQPESSENRIHIIIHYSNQRYFISCIKFRGKYLALNFEKVVIE